MKRQTLLLTVLLALLPGCSPGGGGRLLGPPPDQAAARVEVEAALMGFAAALNAGDIDAALEFLSRQAILESTLGRQWESDRDGRTSYGRDGIGAFLSAVRADYQEFNLALDLKSLHFDGWIATGPVNFSFSGAPTVESAERPALFARISAFTFQYEDGRWVILQLSDRLSTVHDEGTGGNI